MAALIASGGWPGAAVPAPQAAAFRREGFLQPAGRLPAQLRQVVFAVRVGGHGIRTPPVGTGVQVVIR